MIIYMDQLLPCLGFCVWIVLGLLSILNNRMSRKEARQLHEIKAKILNEKLEQLNPMGTTDEN